MKTYEVAGNSYSVPDLSLEQTECIIDLIDRTGLLNGSAAEVDDILNRPIGELLQLLGKKKLLREFLAIIMVQKDTEWSAENLEVYMNNLGRLPLKIVLEVGKDFLSANAELLSSFKSFFPEKEELTLSGKKRVAKKASAQSA